jgi:hypothetical protein
MILAYLIVCIPAFGPDFCLQQKALPQHFATEEKCWDAVHHFMDDNTKSGATTINYTFKCADNT